MMYLNSQGSQHYEKNSKSIPEILKSKNEKNILNFEKIKKIVAGECSKERVYKI